jgi:cyclic pyranopterin phosphate synthase
MAKDMQKWHLRFTVTAKCNYRCAYCNPEGIFNMEDMPKKEVIEILQAAYNSGINRVHWTGGEPTVRQDFPELVKSAKEIGFQNQIITTNGWCLDKILDKLIANGLTRVIVSLDTLKTARSAVKTSNEHVIKGIEEAVKRLETPTKISCVVMKSTLPEMKDFVEFAHQINNKGYRGKLVLKFNQFFPSNPAQLTREGQKYWLNEFATFEEIFSALNTVGKLTALDRKGVEGDNPSYRYYTMKGYDVTIGILALFSWGYPCGRCHKLRVTPSGQLSICIQTEDTGPIAGKSLQEKTKIITDLLEFREKELDKIMPVRHHFVPQLGVFRFGKVYKPESMDYFYKILEEKKK